jgi:hypothetical protein
MSNNDNGKKKVPLLAKGLRALAVFFVVLSVYYFSKSIFK